MRLGADWFVGEPVVEHPIDEVPGGFGQASDFAVTRPFFPAVEIGEIAEEAGRSASTRAERWAGGFMDWWMLVAG